MNHPKTKGIVTFYSQDNKKLRINNEEKCCGTCYWHKKCCGEFQCFNESADGYALETAYDDGKDCEEWEER